MNNAQFFLELLKDKNMAKHLINVFFHDGVRRDYLLNDLEKQAINDAYDYMNLYSAIGMDIVGEDTENTQIVAQALATNYKILLPYLNPIVFNELSARLNNDKV
jgi:hypothetical protein